MSEGSVQTERERGVLSVQGNEGRAAHRAVKSWDTEPAAHYLNWIIDSFQFMSLNLIWIGHILQEVPLKFDFFFFINTDNALSIYRSVHPPFHPSIHTSIVSANNMHKLYICDPLGEIQAEVSKSNYDKTSIKVWFLPLISL